MPSFDPFALPADLPPVPVGVFLFNDGVNLIPLPHVRCTRVTWHEGARPAEAEFRYVLDDDLLVAHPPGFAQLVGLANGHPGVLREDDRLVVGWTTGSGAILPLFDGFVRLPELSLDGDGLRVPIQAVQVAVRAWDRTLQRVPWRDVVAPDNPLATATRLALATRFNPGGKPNCTGEGADYEDQHGNQYPVFIDPDASLPSGAPEGSRRYWTIDRVVRLLLGIMEPTGQWIAHPTKQQLEAQLSRVLPTGPGPIDPGNEETFRLVRPFVNDQSAVDRPWPEFLEQLLASHGFRFRFSLRVGSTGRPETTIVFYHETDPIPGAGYGPVSLQLPGEALDPTRSNLAQARLQRDSTQVVNRQLVRMGRTRYEAALVLLPGFQPDPTDTTPEAIDAFRKTKESPEVDPRKYRSWVYGETGEGYWKRVEGGTPADHWRVGPGTEVLFEVGPFHQFAIRRRPALPKLLDDGDRPGGRPRLGILANYTGPGPGVWDGTGEVYWVKGGWRLDPDRMGILIEADDPNDWAIGGHESVEALNGGRIRLIDLLNGTNGVSQAADVPLLLVCAFDSDYAEFADTGFDPSSPTAFEVLRATDSSDRHKSELIHESSPNFDPDRMALTPDGEPWGFMVVRDDRERALADAEARLAASSTVRFAGSLTIPRFVVTYPIGGRVTGIAGHDLSFRLDAGAGGSPGVYPRIVRVDWELDRGQYTTLHLSDTRGRPGDA